MLSNNTQWGEGLVRQIGPWQPTAKDIFSFAAPGPYDPSDQRFLQPDGTPNSTDTRAQWVTDGGGKTIIKTPKYTTVINRIVDDPRLNAPGRRLSNNRILGAKRQPIEPVGDIRALSSSMQEIQPKPAPEQEEKVEEEEVFLPRELIVPPYTMPDKSKPAPFMTQNQIDAFQAMVEANRQKDQGLIAQVMDPFKNTWNALSLKERQLARKAFEIFNEMTLEQQVRELQSKTSIVGTLFRRAQKLRGEQNQTIQTILQTIADVVMFGAFLL